MHGLIDRKQHHRVEGPLAGRSPLGLERRDSLTDPPTLRERQRLEHEDWLQLRRPDPVGLPTRWQRLLAWLCCAHEVAQAYGREQARHRAALDRCTAYRRDWLLRLQDQWEARYGVGEAGRQVCCLVRDPQQQRQALQLLAMHPRQVEWLPNASLRASLDALALASRSHDRVTRVDLRRQAQRPRAAMAPRTAHRLAQALLDRALTHPEAIAHAQPLHRDDVKGRTAIRATRHDAAARALRMNVDIALEMHPGCITLETLVDLVNSHLVQLSLPPLAGAGLEALRGEGPGVVVVHARPVRQASSRARAAVPPG